MKHTIILLLSFFTFQLCAVAQQSPIVSTASDFIRQQKFEEGIKYVDSIIKTDSRNVDAMMMKGNLILNHDLWNQPDPQLIVGSDESIYSETFEVGTEQKKVVSTVTEMQVAMLWLKCLQLDSNRLDIRKGLAMLYAMALDIPKLKNAIQDIKRVEPDNGEQAFNLNEYARKVKERGRFDDALEIYRYISTLYPHVAGVRADMASEYFYEGRLNDALTWLDSTFNFKTVDETSFLNGAYLYSELGYFDDAQNVLNTYSRIYDRKMGNFYYGLRQFADSADGYYETLKYFSEIIDSNAYYSEYVLSKQLLNYRYSFTLADYKATLNMNVPQAYKVLIHTRAVKQFADCEPYIRFGIQQSMARNYGAAVQFLEEAESCTLDANQREYWQLAYGYALYYAGQYDKAMAMLSPVRNAENAFRRDAAMYFVGLCLLKSGKADEAKTEFEKIKSGENKFTTLAQYRLNKLK